MGERGRAFARRELIRSSLLDRYEAALGLDLGPSEATARPAPTDPRATSSAPAGHVAGRAGSRGRMLVTGATGSIGPSVVAAARAAGWRVRVLVRGASAFPDDVEVAVGDLRDPGSVRAAVSGCEVVVHLAGLAHRTGPGTDDEHRAVTRDGAVAVFAAAEAAGCERVVFASSISVYGRDGTFDEAAPLRPRNAYAEAKVAAEADLRGRTRVGGAPLGTILRLATCYGPSAAGNVTAMADALAHRRFVLVGSGANRKSLLHVDDAAAAIVLAAGSATAAGRTYDVSDGRPQPLRAIVGELCAALGRPMPVAVPVAPLRLAVRMGGAAATALGHRPPVEVATIDTLVADVAVAATRIRTELGFVPAVDLVAGLTGTVAARSRPPADHASRGAAVTCAR
jgi:UDP-glucose 4-epimerase